MAIASYFRISIMPAGCLLGRGISPFPFTTPGSLLLGSRLLVLGFSWRRYCFAHLKLVCTRMFRTRLFLQILLESTRALAVNFPFYHHRGFHHRIHPGGTGSRDLLVIISCPDD